MCWNCSPETMQALQMDVKAFVALVLALLGVTESSMPARIASQILQHGDAGADTGAQRTGGTP